MTQVVRYEPTGDAAVDHAVRHWGQASLLPKAYRLNDGSPDWPNLVIAATVLRVLDVEPFPNLPDTYVVNGRVGLMAALQVALAQRADAYPEVVDSDDRHAVARLLHGASWGCAWCLRPAFEGHYAEVDIDHATKAGWTRRNPNYGTMPRAMLEARVITALLRRTAPGVLRGIASSIAPVAPLDTEGALSGGVGVGNTPPASTDTPGYYTAEIPEPMRAQLLARLADLDATRPEVAAELRAEWKSLRGPVVAYDADTPRGRWAMLPDALVLRYMIDEAEGALEASGVAVQANSPTTVDLHDDAPEPGGTEPDDEASYAPDDDGRPF